MLYAYWDSPMFSRPRVALRSHVTPIETAVGDKTSKSQGHLQFCFYLYKWILVFWKQNGICAKLSSYSLNMERVNFYCLCAHHAGVMWIPYDFLLETNCFCFKLPVLESKILGWWDDLFWLSELHPQGPSDRGKNQLPFNALWNK